MKPKRIGTMQVVDAATGEVLEEHQGAMLLMPPGGDVCQECGTDHPWDMPHDGDSMYFKMQFHAKRGRWPTWTDAMAHCSDEVRAGWRATLREVMAEQGMEIPEDLREDLDGKGGGRG